MDQELPSGAGVAFPVGTQVVTRLEVLSAGGDVLYPLHSVGVIVDSTADPEVRYIVRFPDGGDARLRQDDLVARKHFQRQATSGAYPVREQQEQFEYVIYRCVVGSRAYGLENEASDFDRRGIYLPTAERQWSLAGVPEQLELEEAFLSSRLPEAPLCAEGLNELLVHTRLQFAHARALTEEVHHER